MIAVHELIEVLLCKAAGVTQEDVDKFDLNFEKKRKKGDDSEPGDDPKAPYYKQHKFATKIERLLCKELGENWNWYETDINNQP